MSRKIIAMVLMVLLLFSTLPLTVLAEEINTDGDSNVDWSNDILTPGWLDGAPVIFEGMMTRATATLTQTMYYEYEWISKLDPNGPTLIGHWCVDRINGEIAYCVEPLNGNSIDGSQLTSSITWGGLAAWQQERISQVIGYGYPYTNGLMAHVATQVMIWEIAMGYMDYNMNLTGWTGVSGYFCNQWPGVSAAYQSIRNAVLNHDKLPSFTNAVSSSASTYEMPWSGTLTLNDTNGVLSGFQTASVPGGVSASISGSRLTLTTNNPGGAAGTVKLIKNTSVKGLVYWLSGPQQVKATATGSQVSLEAYVKLRGPSTGNLTIEKVDSVTGNALPGATIQLKQGNTVITTVTTGSDGKAAIKEIVPGAYQVMEITAPSGYFLNTTPIPITIVAGQNHTVRLENTPKSTIQLIKRDSVTNGLLDGITFNIAKSDGTNIGNYVTANGGQFTVGDLIAGTYIITETSTLPTHVLDTTPITVTLAAGETAVIELTNIPYPKLEIEKISAQTGLPVPGVTFLLMEADGTVIGEYVTDTDGRIIFENILHAGDYLLQEIDVPEWLVLDDAIKEITLEWGQTTSVIVENNEYPTLELLKLDEQDNDIALEGFTFQLMYPDGTVIDEYVTDSDGKIVIENTLMSGDYLIQEIAVPKPVKYVLDNTLYEIKLEWGETTSITLENTRTATLELLKVDAESGEPLAGATYALYASDGSKIGEYKTDSDGHILFSCELPPDDYVVVETQAPLFHILDATPIKVTLYPGETTVIERENQRQKGRIQIVKVAGGYSPVTGDKEGTPLAGAQFAIYNEQGELVEIITSDSRGIAESGLHDVGIYTCKEITAPDYYLTNGETFTVHIRHHLDVVKVTVKDTPVVPGVSITKDGPAKAKAGQTITYAFSDIQNLSNVPLDEFHWWDELPTEAVRLERIETGTWNDENVLLGVFIRTNMNSDYRLIASGLTSNENHVIDCSAAVLNLRDGEYVTGFRIGFGTVQPGFREEQKPKAHVRILDTVQDGYTFVNHTGVAGRYLGKWVISRDDCPTAVSNPPKDRLPKTGR